MGGAALALAAGFATAKLHTEMARAPVLTKEMRGVTGEGLGRTLRASRQGQGQDHAAGDRARELPPEKAPYRVRVTLPAASAKVATGEAVSLKATLRPPPEPIAPHGFDFGRTAWFDRLGATGYGTGTIDALAGAGEAPLGLRLWAAIDRLRSLVNARIRASLPGERGEIAAALITGERAGISQDVNQAMRNSGLFHILSISGLHMVIMAGTVFWLVRAGLALIPSIALRYPIRKWAAGAALAAALFYLLPLRRRGAHGALLDHDEHRALGDDPRPAGAHHAQRGARRLADPVDHTGKPVRSELRNVVCRRGRSRRPGRDEQQARGRPGAGCELPLAGPAPAMGHRRRRRHDHARRHRRGGALRHLSFSPPVPLRGRRQSHRLAAGRAAHHAVRAG